MIIWLTGLPCAGKTTIARALAERLESRAAMLESGRIVELLDGDDLRSGAFADAAGFSPEQRRLHLRRVGYMAERLARHVPYVICAFVSPSETVRAELPIDVLVHVDCPPEVCAKRDVKGLWARAMAGESHGFTGYDAPYDRPDRADVTVHTDKLGVQTCVDAIVAYLRDRPCDYQ